MDLMVGVGVGVGFDVAAPMRAFFFFAADSLLNSVDSRIRSKVHKPIHRHSILPCSAERSESPPSGHLLTATTWQPDANDSFVLLVVDSDDAEYGLTGKPYAKRVAM